MHDELSPVHGRYMERSCDTHHELSPLPGTWNVLCTTSDTHDELSAMCD